ncbi:hypothetical protein FRB91_006355 [Serendipita sp. 411]|nr:hypothetical protein FRB91_006355 [Serendipita sp. 411]
MLVAAIPFLALSLPTLVNAAPSTLLSYKTWSSYGCYEDEVSSRKLPYPVATEGGPSSMTVERCLDACFAAGYTVAGLEWSQECFCGYSLPPTPATDGRCDMECKGDASELCGGGNGLTVYQSSGPTSLQTYNGWTYNDCYVDSIWSRVLPHSMSVSGSMTIEKCLDACSAAGFEYAGVEYAQECFCGLSAPSQVATDGRCSMPCKGNPAELCGGGNGINVYHHLAPTNLQPYKSWTYSNCYVDSISDRVLPQTMVLHGGGMTVEWCLDACDAAGYAFAGVEYGKECYCGRDSPSDVANDGRCNMSCEGNAGELCGGPNGVSVYHSSNPNHQPGNLDSYKDWTFSGCYVDSVDHRVLPVRAAIERDPDMTVELCLESCKYLGFKVAGLEYEQECWCGDSIPPEPATDGRCNMVCNGNHNELCGGQSGISVYEFCAPVTTTITTTTGVVTEYTTLQTIATDYTDTATSNGLVTGTTTIVVPTTITTTIPIPITATTTVIGDVVLTTSLATVLTGSTVITVPVTVPITVPTPIVASTTIPVPLTGSTTVPVTLTGPTTVPIPFTAISTVLVPSTITSSVPVLSTGIATVPVTVARTSFTLSVFTGTTSFVDRLTTIFQPVIILTTLARTYTTTTGSPSPFTTSYPVTTLVGTSVISSFPITATTFTTTPFVTTSSVIAPVPTTSLGIETFPATSFFTAATTTPTAVVQPFPTTSFFGQPVTSTTTGFEPFTTTSSSIAEVPTATTIVTEFTTTTVGYIPYTTTVYNAEPTTVTTTYASPITVTTTIVTACEDCHENGNGNGQTSTTSQPPV